MDVIKSLTAFHKKLLKIRNRSEEKKFHDVTIKSHFHKYQVTLWAFQKHTKNVFLQYHVFLLN